MLLPKDRADELHRPKGLRKDVREGLTVEWEDENWTVLRKGECPAPSFNRDALAGHPSRVIDRYVDWGTVIGEVYLDDTNLEAPSLAAKAWLNVIGNAPIPFLYSERRQKLAAAFKKLGDYVARWEEHFLSQAESKHGSIED